MPCFHRRPPRQRRQRTGPLTRRGRRVSTLRSLRCLLWNPSACSAPSCRMIRDWLWLSRARDRLVKRTPRRQGWRVLLVWEHDLTKKNEPRLMRRLQRAMAPRDPVL